MVHVPVILNGNRDIPYRTLTLKGELLAPNLAFDPECLRLTPVPLNTEVSVNLNIIARGYRKYVNSIRHFIPTFMLYILFSLSNFLEDGKFCVSHYLANRELCCSSGSVIWHWQIRYLQIHYMLLQKFGPF